MQDDPSFAPIQHPVLTVIAALRLIFQADYWSYTSEEAAEIAVVAEEEAREAGEDVSNEGPEDWYRQDFEQARVVSTFLAALFEAAKIPVLIHLGAYLVDETDAALDQIERSDHAPPSPAERVRHAARCGVWIEALQSAVATTLFTDSTARDQLSAAAEAAGLPASLQIPSGDEPGEQGWSDAVLITVQDLEYQRRSSALLPPQGSSTPLHRVNAA